MSKVVKVIAMVVVAAAIIVFAPQIAGFLATLGATSVTAGAVAAAGIGLAISTALSVAMSFFVKPPSLTNALIDRLNSSIQPTAPRKIVFGRTAAGNDIRYFEEHGKNDHYTQVIALASHRIEALRQYYMEEELTWENNNVQGEFESGVRFLRYVKEGNSSNFQEVGTGENWKPTATFTGCAYSVVSFRLKNDVFEKGFPSKTTWVVDGCPLYDPRRDSTRGGVGAHRINDQNSWRFYDGAVEIGRNPALALAVYLTGYRINGKLVWGMGVPADRIDWDSIRDYANLCEERVATQSGSTIQRYTADGIFSTADSHESVISALTAAMGSCKLTDVGGRYTIIGGYDDTLGPTIDFTADHLVAAPGQPAPYSWIPASPARETYNIARGRFSDPANQYQLADWGAIETDPLPDGVPRTMQIDLGMVSRSETCQRIAKQFLLREALTPGHFAGTFGPLAFAAVVGSLVTLSLPQEGWNRKLFRVVDQAETHDLLFQLTLREEDPAVYAWDREEKPMSGNIRPPGYKSSFAFAPADLDVTSHAVANADGVETSEVTVTWTPEDSGQVRAIQIEAKPAGVDAWTEQAANADPATGSFTFMSNRPAALLNVRARFKMFSGVFSAWAYHDVETAPVAIVDSVARDQIEQVIAGGGLPAASLAPVLEQRIQKIAETATDTLLNGDRYIRRVEQAQLDFIDLTNLRFDQETVAREALEETITDPVTGLAKVHTLVSQETAARVSDVGGLATRIDTLDARFGVAGQPGSVEAKITTAQNAYVSPLAGQASRIDSLNTRFGVQGQPGSVEAAIETARTAYVTPLSGQTQRIDSLNTRLGVEGQPGSVEAKIVTAQNAYVTPLSGQTQRIDALNTRFGVAGQPGSVEAAIETARTAYVTPLSGQTQRIDSLNTRLGVEGQPGSVEAKIVTAQNAYVTPLSGQTQRIDSLNTRLGVAGQPGSVEAKIVTAQNAYVTPLEAEAGRIDGILTRIGTAGQPGSMEAKITTAQNAYVGPLGVQAGRIDSVFARLNNGGDIAASISSQAGAIADLQGRTSAYWSVEAVAGGRAQLKVWADSVSGGGVDIVGDLRISGDLLVGGSVGTNQIGLNQVTVPVSAFTAAAIGLPDGVWTTVQTAAITASGSPIFVAAGHSMEVEPANDRDVDYRILRDGTVIYQIDDVSFSTYMASADWALHNIFVTDTPPAGGHTYQFQAKTNDGASCKNRSLFLLETKR